MLDGLLTMSFDVYGYLQEKLPWVKRASEVEVHGPCPFHNEDPEKRGRLYVNITPDADPLGLFTCLAGETRVITKKGTFPIEELVGETPELLVNKGNGPSVWHSAPVESFGHQTLYEINLSRNGVKKTIRATAEHRWFKDRRQSSNVELTTVQLKPGDILASSFTQSCKTKSKTISPHGIVRGFIYGDGTKAFNSSVAYLFGEKDSVLGRFLTEELSSIHTKPAPYSGDYRRVSGFPGFYKDELPSLDESVSYLYGWLSGLFLADGSNSNASPQIDTVSLEAADYIVALCQILGIKTSGVKTYKRMGVSDNTKFGIVNNKMFTCYRVGLNSEDLSDDFFLYKGHAPSKKAFSRDKWQVVSVMETDYVEEVFCAVVDGVGNFTLDGNILTGNCHRCR